MSVILRRGNQRRGVKTELYERIWGRPGVIGFYEQQSGHWIFIPSYPYRFHLPWSPLPPRHCHRLQDISFSEFIFTPCIYIYYYTPECVDAMSIIIWYLRCHIYAHEQYTLDAMVRCWRTMNWDCSKSVCEIEKKKKETEKIIFTYTYKYCFTRASANDGRG